ncbi:MAG TPA: peptidoglycan-binding protein LysM [Epsilonproteobacteria bacterium]|nr:peptidoglycan-binding protein LysM [Campylobacterota bacterium]
MGFFDFLSNAGKKILGKGDDAKAVKDEIEGSFSELPVQGLVVDVNGDTVTLAGVAKDIATREKAILIAGNIEGIAKVDADQLVTLEHIANENVAPIPEPRFYTIQKGDTLWKIATDFYKDGSKYPLIVEANQEVIKDADLIYPGQNIRIPELA